MSLFTLTQKNMVAKILTFGLVALVAVACVMPMNFVHAQAAGPVPGQPPSNPYTGQQYTEPAGPPAPGSCWTDVYCHLTKFAATAANWVATALLTFGGLILWMAGVMLKFVIEYTIVGLPVLVNSTGAGSFGGAISSIWVIFRDIANMFFIFILLYAAIGTILDLGSVNMQKTLRNVIIVAILLNFSLFFAKLLVDISNILTVTFYNQISNSVAGNQGIAGPFMQNFGLTTLFDVKGVSALLNSVSDGLGLKMLQVGFFGLIFMLVAAFVFFAISILFIKRFVTIIFLFIVSPLAFAAIALPSGSGYWNKWWKSMMNQLIFPPVCLAMIWVSLQMSKVIVVKSTATAAAGGSTMLTAIIGTPGGEPDPLGFQLVVGFIITIGLLIASMIAASEAGAKGASGLMKTGKKWAGNLQSYVGRNTIGRAAARLDKDITSGKPLLDNKFVGKIPLVGGALGAVNKKAGQLLQDASNTRAGRYIREETTEAVAKAKFGGGISRSDDIKRLKELRTDIKSKSTMFEKVRALEEGVPDELTDERKAGMTAAAITAYNTEREKKDQEVAGIISTMSNKDLEGVNAKQLAKHARYLNPRQLEHLLEKSEKLSEEDKGKIRTARYEPTKKAIETLDKEETEKARIAAIADPAEKKKEEDAQEAALDKARNRIKGLSPKEIELLSDTLLTADKFIENLKAGQIEAITKADNIAYTDSQKEKVKDMRSAPIVKGFEPGAPREVKEKAIRLFKGLDPKDKGKIDIKILKDPEILATYNQKTLMKMSDEMKDSARADLKQTILDAVSTPGALVDPQLQKVANWLMKPEADEYFG